VARGFIVCISERDIGKQLQKSYVGAENGILNQYLHGSKSTRPVCSKVAFQPPSFGADLVWGSIDRAPKGRSLTVSVVGKN